MRSFISVLLLAPLLVGCDSAKPKEVLAGHPLVGVWRMIEHADTLFVESQIDQVLVDLDVKRDVRIQIDGVVSATLTRMQGTCFVSDRGASDQVLACLTNGYSFIRVRNSTGERVFESTQTDLIARAGGQVRLTATQFLEDTRAPQASIAVSGGWSHPIHVVVAGEETVLVSNTYRPPDEPQRVAFMSDGIVEIGAGRGTWSALSRDSVEVGLVVNELSDGTPEIFLDIYPGRHHLTAGEMVANLVSDNSAEVLTELLDLDSPTGRFSVSEVEERFAAEPGSITRVRQRIGHRLARDR